MKIEKISYNKIKVTVTSLDMLKWGVSLDNFVEDTPEARELFWTLIKRAEYETGFSFNDSRLVVEAVPHKYDGLVLFVTKIEEEPDITQAVKKSRLRAKMLHQKPAFELFEFSDLEKLIECAGNITDITNADLYSHMGKYYLAVYEEYISTALSEYGDKVIKGEFMLPHIKEHGKLLAERNALEVIKKYFVK